MSTIIVLFLSCLFLHIVDDYYLQGWLASAKQKKWWQNNAPDDLYKNDYKIALFMHAFSWTFMMMLPLLIYCHFDMGWLFLLYPANIVIHSLVDNLKANKLKINLIQDQLIHILQIIVTIAIICLVKGV